MKRSYLIVIAVIIVVFFVVFSDSSYNPKIALADYFFSKGNGYYSGEDYDLSRAKRYFELSLHINPKTPYAHYQLARIYLVQNELRKAKKEIDDELRSYPEHKRSFYIRGLIDGYSHNFQEAQDDFKKFIEYAPGEWAGYMDLSWVYINDKKFDEAIVVTDKGLKRFPDHIWLLANKGLALYKIGKYEEAREILEKDKELAKNLTFDDWKMAYPGNDPKGAEEGVKEIKATISYNLSLIYKNLNETEKYLKEVEYFQSFFPVGDARRNKILDTL